MIELAWVPFVLLFMCFAAYVLENWPDQDPFDDMAHEDRRVTDMAHKR